MTIDHMTKSMFLQSGPCPDEYLQKLYLSSLNLSNSFIYIKIWATLNFGSVGLRNGRVMDDQVSIANFYGGSPYFQPTKNLFV